jgi:hypothetical protein
VKSRIPGECGDLLSDKNHATSENCQGGQCTQKVGLSGPNCNENNTILVLAFQPRIKNQECYCISYRYLKNFYNQILFQEISEK